MPKQDSMNQADKPKDTRQVQVGNTVTHKVFLEVIQDVGEGNTLKDTLKKHRIKERSWFYYMEAAPQAEVELLTQARLNQADSLFERAIQVIDKIESEEVNPQAGKAMLDGLKWATAKLKPAKYGDRVDYHVNHTIDIGSNILQARERILSSSSQRLKSKPMINVTDPIGGVKALEGGGEPNKKDK